MSETFDPAKHILVVRDRETGRHVHVEFQEVVRQIAAAPAMPVDLSEVHRRLAALETRLPTSDGELARSVFDAAANLSGINARLATLEAAYGVHSHDYKLSEHDLQMIASAVLEQIRLAGVKAA